MTFLVPPPLARLLYRPIVELPGLSTRALIVAPQPGGDEPSLEHACADLALQPGGGSLPAVLPLSRSQWRDPALPQRLADALGTHGIARGRLQLAVTESVGLEDDLAMAALDAAHEAGAGVVLMAFGSGLTSLASLDRLPIDEVMLDPGLVTQLADSAYQRALVSALATVAASLELRLTVDGVQTHRQTLALAELGCSRAAGPLFGSPHRLHAQGVSTPIDPTLQH